MYERSEFAAVGRNLLVYVVGVSLAVVGALGLSDAIGLANILAIVLFVSGIAVVLVVHEFLDGPL